MLPHEEPGCAAGFSLAGADFSFESQPPQSLPPQLPPLFASMACSLAASPVNSSRMETVTSPPGTWRLVFRIS